MATISQVFTGRTGPRPYVIRPLRPGDLGWVVQRHGEQPHHSYGHDLVGQTLELDLETSEA